MNVLFIIPKRNRYTILPAPDIGVAYIARAALNAGTEVTILDAHKEGIPPFDLTNFLKNKNFDLIGIKCLSIDIYNVLEYCRVIKEFNRDIITVLGGHHPTAMPEYTMRSQDVDYIIKGEGELGISSLIKKLIDYNGEIPQQEKNNIPCLVYRDENNKVKSNPLILEEDIDNLGFPAWHLFRIKEYSQLPGSGGRFLPIITSRGCPSNCTFCCSDSIHGRKIRLRSPEHVISEIKWLINDFSIKRVSIFDDNFAISKKHAMAICELYKKENLPVRFDIPQGIRINNLDRDILIELEEARCDYMGMGIESGEQETLNLIKKGTNISQIQEKIDMIKRYTNIKLMGFFVIGFPHETVDNILKTLSFSLRLKLDYAAFAIFTPFPGTELFDQMVKEGYFSIDNLDWGNLLLDSVTFQHKNISSKRLKKLQRKAYIRFYFRLSKIPFFFRVVFREFSFTSYLRRFVSILKG